MNHRGAMKLWIMFCSSVNASQNDIIDALILQWSRKEFGKVAFMRCNLWHDLCDWSCPCLCRFDSGMQEDIDHESHGWYDLEDDSISFVISGLSSCCCCCYFWWLLLSVGCCLLAFGCLLSCWRRCCCCLLFVLWASFPYLGSLAFLSIGFWQVFGISLGCHFAVDSEVLRIYLFCFDRDNFFLAMFLLSSWLAPCML